MSDSDDTKQRIYETALDVFYEQGYASASMRTIMRGAGVQMSSVYYHFANKQEILFEIMRRAISESTQWLVDNIAGCSGAENKLRAAIAAEVNWHTNRQREAFIADAELLRLDGRYREDIVALRDAEETIFRDILQEGIDTGEFACPDVGLVTRMMLSATTGVARWYRPDGLFTPESIAKAFGDTLIEGLRERGQ